MPKKKTKKRRGHAKKSIEKEYYDEIEITCPVTGEKIKQKVKVTRLKSKYASPWKKAIGSPDELDSYDSDEPEYDEDE